MSNHAEPCWFVFAVVRRKIPPLITCGLDGEPLVKIWQEGGGVLLFAHTLLVVNPPTGKLKDCANAGGIDEIARRHIVVATTANHTPRIAVFSVALVVWRLLDRAPSMSLRMGPAAQMLRNGDPELGSIKRGRTYYKAVRRPFWGLKTILSRKNRKWRPKETLIRSKLNCARGVTKTLG